MSEDKKHDHEGGESVPDHPGEDFVVLGPTTEDGVQTVIRHREDHTLELAELHTVEDGKPLREDAEIVKLSGEGPRYKVETVYDGRKGPAKVSTKKYREGWDAVFGKKPEKDLN